MTKSRRYDIINKSPEGDAKNHEGQAIVGSGVAKITKGHEKVFKKGLTRVLSYGIIRSAAH